MFSTDTAVASEALSILGTVDFLLDVGAYLGTKHYTFVLQSVHTFLTHCRMHQTLLNTAMYNTSAVRKFFVHRVRTNPFWLYSTKCFVQYEEQLKQAEQKKAELQLDTNNDYFGSVNSPIAISTDNNTPGQFSLSGKFQLSEPMADSPSGQMDVFFQPSPAVKSNGFNFASMKSSRPSSVNMHSGSNTPILSPLTAPATDIFGSFDLPPPARHTRASSRIYTIGISDTIDSSATSPKTPLDSGYVTNGVIADSVFDFAPPARPRRVSSTTVPVAIAVNMRNDSTKDSSYGSDSTPVKGEPASVEEVTPKPRFSLASAPSAPTTPNTNTAAVASSNSIFDSNFDFAPPARHTRASRPTSISHASDSPGGGASSPVPSSIHVATVNISTAAVSVEETQPVSTKASFNFASSRPAAVQSTAPVGAEVKTADTLGTGREGNASVSASVTAPIMSAPVAVRSVLDDFDSFAPPPRASRRVTTSNTVEDKK